MADPDARAKLAAFLKDPRAWDERSHGEWVRARDMANPDEQQAFSVPEHRSFAREFTSEHPAIGSVAIPLSALGYYLAKKTGLKKGRSEADFDQVFAGLEGTGQGLKDAITGRETPKDPQY